MRTTRRLPWIEADWSAIGGEGGTSPAASAAAGAAAGASPQLEQPPAQLLQQLLQVLQLPHDLWHLNRPSKPPHFFLQQPVLQQLLQLLHGSQHEGAAWQQVGSQHEGAASQQVGSQAEAQHDDWQQLFLHLWQSNRPPRPPNKQHFFLQQLLQLLQLLHESQHEGAASQQVGSQAGAAQVGSQLEAAQQVGSQQLGAAQQDGSQQLLHEPPPPP